MQDSFKQGLEITEEIVKDLSSKGYLQGDLRQIQLGIHPTISNAIYNRDKDLLEKERFETLITLARVLDNETIEKAVTALKYTLTVKK